MKEIPNFHELCLIFPACTEEELEALRADIELNGLRTPITLYESKILDGRNRAVACYMLGITPKYETYLGNDPLGLVISRNLHRRHLNESQRASIAAKLTLLENEKRVSINDAGKIMNVSPRNISRAVYVQKNADPETIDAIMQGKKSVSATDKEIRQSIENSETTDAEQQLLFLCRLVTRDAQRLKKDLDSLFERTGWSTSFTELHNKVRKIVFDE
jgi:hypothetical protein